MNHRADCNPESEDHYDTEWACSCDCHITTDDPPRCAMRRPSQYAALDAGPNSDEADRG